MEIDFTRRDRLLDGGRGEANAPPSAVAAAEGARRSVRFAVAHLTERQAIVSEREYFDVALKHAIGSATLADARRELQRLARTGYLVAEQPLYRSADEPLTANAMSCDG